MPPRLCRQLTPWDLLLRQRESQVSDTNQGLVVTCRFQRDSGKLDQSQGRAWNIKGLESKAGAGMPEPASPTQLLCGRVVNRLAISAGFKF